MTANEKSILRARILKWLTRIFLIIIAVIMLFPLVWNIYSSFKTNTEFLANAFALPGGLEWDNYARAIEKSELGANIFNSLFIVVETLCILTVCAIPCSYCLVRYKLQMNSLGLLNNRPAMGFLYAAMQFPFAIFLLTGFMRSIPRDYEEAAMIDGCSPAGVLRHVIVPMAKPGIVTVCMISAMSAWNEYPVALVMLTDAAKQTLPVGIANLYEVQRYATDWGALFAALVLALIPTVVLFLIGQKQLLQGMNVGGIKG